MLYKIISALVWFEIVIEGRHKRVSAFLPLRWEGSSRLVWLNLLNIKDVNSSASACWVKCYLMVILIDKCVDVGNRASPVARDVTCSIAGVAADSRCSCGPVGSVVRSSVTALLILCSWVSGLCSSEVSFCRITLTWKSSNLQRSVCPEEGGQVLFIFFRFEGFLLLFENNGWLTGPVTSFFDIQKWYLWHRFFLSLSNFYLRVIAVRTARIEVSSAAMVASLRRHARKQMGAVKDVFIVELFRLRRPQSRWNKVLSFPIGFIICIFSVHLFQFLNK